MTRRYAEDTKVPVTQSRAEIEALIGKQGGTTFATMIERTKAIVVFECKNRRIRFDLPLLNEPDANTTAARNTAAKENRRRWRALLLCIKAKFESVHGGIETFDSAFLAHIVLPTGETIGDAAIPQIGAAYEGRPMRPLLEGPR